jgi:hypothetical protein
MLYVLTSSLFSTGKEQWLDTISEFTENHVLQSWKECLSFCCSDKLLSQEYREQAWLNFILFRVLLLFVQFELVVMFGFFLI